MNGVHTEKDLKESVERQARRMEKAEHERTTLLGQTVYLGTMGLLFILPVIGGAYLGYWLDNQALEYSARWTVSLIISGVVIGALNVYFFIRNSA